MDTVQYRAGTPIHFCFEWWDTQSKCELMQYEHALTRDTVYQSPNRSILLIQKGQKGASRNRDTRETKFENMQKYAKYAKLFYCIYMYIYAICKNYISAVHI